MTMKTGSDTLSLALKTVSGLLNSNTNIPRPPIRTSFKKYYKDNPHWVRTFCLFKAVAV